MIGGKAGRDTALVTSGAQGLGAAIASALHAAGMNVGIADLNGEGASALASTLDAPGQTAIAFPLDVREEADFVAVGDALIARWSAVQVPVNNAAITVARPVLDIGAEEFDAVLAVNLHGTFLGCQFFGRLFKANGYGRIVNFASLAGQNGGTATGAHYATSKGGIVTMTKVFARDLAPFDVTVNAIAPGPLDTPMLRRTISRDRMAQFPTNIPVGQLGDPAFVASMTARLCLRDAAFMKGATIDINGGLYMR